MAKISRGNISCDANDFVVIQHGIILAETPGEIQPGSPANHCVLPRVSSCERLIALLWPRSRRREPSVVLSSNGLVAGIIATAQESCQHAANTASARKPTGAGASSGEFRRSGSPRHKACGPSRSPRRTPRRSSRPGRCRGRAGARPPPGSPSSRASPAPSRR